MTYSETISELYKTCFAGAGGSPALFAGAGGFPRAWAALPKRAPAARALLGKRALGPVPHRGAGLPEGTPQRGRRGVHTENDIENGWVAGN